MDHLCHLPGLTLRRAPLNPAARAGPGGEIMNSPSARFVVTALLIAAAAIFLHAHSGNEVFPFRLPLRSFPIQVGDWQGTDVAIDKDVLAVLGPGDFLLRVYQDQREPEPYAD